jgi:hypothetical protein
MRPGIFDNVILLTGHVSSDRQKVTITGPTDRLTALKRVIDEMQRIKMRTMLENAGDSTNRPTSRQPTDVVEITLGDNELIITGDYRKAGITQMFNVHRVDLTNEEPHSTVHFNGNRA